MASNKMENEFRFHAKTSRGLKQKQKNTVLSNSITTCIINTDRPLVQGESLDVMIDNEGNLSLLFLHETEPKVLAEITVDSYQTTQVLQVCFKENTIKVTEMVCKRFEETINAIVGEKIRLRFHITTGNIHITLLDRSQTLEAVGDQQKNNTKPIRLVPLIEEQVSISMGGASASPEQLLHVGFSDREISADEYLVLKIKKQNSERGKCRIMLAPADIMKRILGSSFHVVPQNICRALERRSVLIKTMELKNDMLEMTGIVDFQQKGWPIFYIENITVYLDQEDKLRLKDSLNNGKKIELGMSTIKTSLKTLQASFEEYKVATSKDSRELKQELHSLTKAVEDVKETKRRSKSSCDVNRSLQLLDRWIIPNYTSLCKGINLEDLLPRLLQDGILTDAQYSKVKDIPNYNEKAQTLLDCLKRQPESKRPALIRALKKSTSNEHIIPYFDDTV